jgi:two-component system sensor histidine kinase PilS (NtrC family)
MNKSLGWILSLRFTQFIILFFVVILWMKYPGFIQLPFILYSSASLGILLLLTFKKYNKFVFLSSLLIVIQFVFEIYIEAGIVFQTGGINSQFTALFILTIILAALVYRLIGTLIVSTATSGAYTFVVWYTYYGQEKPLSINIFKTIYWSQDQIFYTVFLHILIFYLVAFIGGYLAERILQRDRQLADTSKALKLARLETDDILRHMNSGLLSVDMSGQIIFFNRSAERILGYKEHEIKGLYFYDAFAERMIEFVNCLAESIEMGIEHPRKEINIVTKNKKIIPLGFSTSILTDEQLNKRGIIAIFSDLTEVKELESKVRTADRLAAVGELSASIAHEIRNPLAAISGSVELLKKEVQVSDDNEKLLNLIVKESDRLTHILNEFLSYAKMDRPSYNKIELCHIVTEVMDIVSHHNSYHPDIDIKFDSDESFMYVFGDENLIKQLLLNLAVNACEAMPSGNGNLFFKVKYIKNNDIELSVTDNGPGIDKNKQNKIFKPFYSTKKEGTGLGLAIVHRICTILKLPLYVESENGNGTSFKVILKSSLSNSYHYENEMNLIRQ